MKEKNAEGRSPDESMKEITEGGKKAIFCKKNMHCTGSWKPMGS